MRWINYKFTILILFKNFIFVSIGSISTCLSSLLVVFVSLLTNFTKERPNISLNKLSSTSLKICASFNLNNLRFISLLSS